MSDSAYLDARYGRLAARPGRVRLLVAGAVVLLLGLVVTLFLWSQAAGSLAYTVSGYAVLSDTQMTVSFSVDKPDGQLVGCRVVAQDRYTDVVGSVDVRLPRAGSHQAMTVTVPTRGLAVVGLVQSCKAVG